MTTRRAIHVVLAVAVTVVFVLLMASPFPEMIVWMVREELFPATISWDGKTAWKRCESAIADKTSWPASVEGACRVMHMCANEAPLSEAQRKKLYQTIKETEGCEES